MQGGFAATPKKPNSLEKRPLGWNSGNRQFARMKSL
jgi:hypothetical protein